MQLMHLLSLLSVVAATVLHRAAPVAFSSRTIFTPPTTYTDPQVLYARNEQLPNGDILATWENYSPEPPMVYFPIYRSKDNGQSWSSLSTVQDTANHLGLRYQPFLYYLPEKIGNYPAGTVLLAGSSIPTDLSSTQIDLYASRDSGATWEFVSHIAAGGQAVPNNGLTPVWEPFLLAVKGKLICYYSDQRANTTHGQKMVHQTTTDLKSWGPVVDDVAYSTYTDRPGMPTVAKLPNGNYIMTYEYGSYFGGSSYSFPIYYRIASDPEKFASASHQQLVVTSGTKPTSSPYVVWTSYGGTNGTIIVSANSHTTVFVNQALGQGSWKEIATPEGKSYTRSLRVLTLFELQITNGSLVSGDSKMLMLMGGGHLPPSTTNKVTVSVLDLSKALA